MSLALSSPPDRAGRARFRTTLIGWRNRLIASPGFQRRVASLPFMRRIAAGRARALFDLCAGFVYSQVLLACVRLGLFETLIDGPVPLTDLASRLDLSRDAAERLVRAATSLRLVRMLPDGSVALDDLGAALVGNPAIAAFIEHHDLLYADLRDPVALLRGEVSTHLSRFWPYAAAHAPDTAAAPRAFDTYSELMAKTQPLVARDIMDAYDFARHQCLLDVGGGDGTFVGQVAERHAALRLMLFDLPPVAARATRNLVARGLQNRITVQGGSFLDDPLPSGADIISLVRVVHDHDDETLTVLFRRAFAALPRGGVLLIAEPFSGTRGAEPMGDAYFGFYLLAMGHGRTRRPNELEALLRAAGFGRVQHLSTRRPLVTGALAATKLSV